MGEILIIKIGILWWHKHSHNISKIRKIMTATWYETLIRVLALTFVIKKNNEKYYLNKIEYRVDNLMWVS